MAKAQIISIVITEGKVAVTYSTGSVRKYPMDKIPGTVTAWMGEHPLEDKAVEEPAQIETTAEIVTEEATETTGFLLIGDPTQEITMEAIKGEAVEAVEDAPQLPALIETEEAPEDATKEEASIQVTGEAIKAQAIAEASETIAKAAAIAVKATKAAPVAVEAAVWTWSKAVNLYYWLTTYLPIGARWIVVHLIWAIQDILPAMREALVTIGRAAGLIGHGASRAASVVAGWLFVGVLATVGAIRVSSKAIHKTVASGWAMREEIIRDMAA